jgi:hypothetical protein
MSKANSSKDAANLIEKSKASPLTEAETAKVINQANENNKDSIFNYKLGLAIGVVIGLIVR